jgi:hypothetical protein
LLRDIDTIVQNNFRTSPPVKRHEGTKIDQ